MPQATQALADAMSAAGFTLEHTGGGCSAWVRWRGDRHSIDGGSVWITTECDPLAPLTLREPATLGVYGPGDIGGEPLALFQFPSVKATLRYLVKLYTVQEA